MDAEQPLTLQRVLIEAPVMLAVVKIRQRLARVVHAQRMNARRCK
jgi:hypothetical protein